MACELDDKFQSNHNDCQHVGHHACVECTTECFRNTPQQAYENCCHLVETKILEQQKM